MQVTYLFEAYLFEAYLPSPSFFALGGLDGQEEEGWEGEGEGKGEGGDGGKVPRRDSFGHAETKEKNSLFEEGEEKEMEKKKKKKADVN